MRLLYSISIPLHGVFVEGRYRDKGEERMAGDERQA